MCEECGCGQEEFEEELSTEEIVEDNNVILNALIDLLIKKNIIGEDEFRQKIQETENEMYEEESEEETD